jgi:hypothetical protein
MEVNAIVKALSDDILESFDPRDDNGDGVFEGGGALQDTQDRVEPFLPDEEQEKRRVARRKAQWAININVIANIILLIAKGVAAGYSSSLSLIASLADSALDLLCTAIVFTTHKLVGWHLNRLRRKFPVGRRRLEPLGILVFSIIMIISFIQILQESVEKLMSKGPHKATQLPPVAIGALAATIGLKGIIWIGCIRIKTTQVQALAQGTSITQSEPLCCSHIPRLQNRRRVQLAVSYLPSSWARCKYLVARSSRSWSAVSVHHRGLG